MRARDYFITMKSSHCGLFRRRINEFAFRFALLDVEKMKK